MKQTASAVLLALASQAVACGGDKPPAATPAAVTPSAAPSAAAAIPSVAAPNPSAAAQPEPPKMPPPSPVAKFSGFSKPESALYDADADRYLVSNINGDVTAKDNNGFISVLSPDGQVTNLKWIQGGKNKVKLDGPKGLAIAKGLLYAADISVVRVFDLKTGAQKPDIVFPGATFLNDVAVGAGGKLYVTDSGVKFGAKGVDDTGTEAVYVVEGGRVKALAKGKELGHPNGVISTVKGPVVCTLTSNEVYVLGAKGAKEDVTKTPAGSLDGLLALGDALLVTSWQSSSIYRGKLGGTFEVVLSEQKSPADIGYDTKRSRLLIPHLTEDMVDVYELK